MLEDSLDMWLRLTPLATAAAIFLILVVFYFDSISSKYWLAGVCFFIKLLSIAIVPLGERKRHRIGTLAHHHSHGTCH